ncbi:MAG: rhodanese-like domain-containing protein [Kofleriaceae bacterium]
MVNTLTPSELADLIAVQSVDLVDVRNENEWDSGHIPGSRNIPLEVLRADPEAQVPHGTIVIFVCAKGVRSVAAAKLADRFGYDRVYNLEGGVKEWASEGLPLIACERAAA